MVLLLLMPEIPLPAVPCMALAYFGWVKIDSTKDQTSFFALHTYVVCVFFFVFFFFMLFQSSRQEATRYYEQQPLLSPLQAHHTALKHTLVKPA